MTDIVTARPGLASSDPSAVAAGRYVVDPAHTRILFSVSHFGLSTYFGEFVAPSGTLDIDPAAPEAARLDVSVASANVTTSNPILDEELRSAAWLDADRYPIIRYVASHIDVVGAGQGRVKGALTLHGVTRPLALDAVFVGGGLNPVKTLYTIGFDGRGVFRRSDFGVLSHLPLIGDTIQLILSGAFELAAQ